MLSALALAFPACLTNSTPKKPQGGEAEHASASPRPGGPASRPKESEKPAPSAAADDANSRPPVSGDVTQVGEERWENGKLKVREEMKLDDEGEWILHGLVEHFWEAGEKKLAIYYKDGVPHGSKKAWYPNGQVYTNGAFVDGREDGVWTTFYLDGRKEAEWGMKLGAWDGPETRWHPNGQKAMHGVWVAGRQTGFFTKYDEEGKIIGEIDYGNPAEKKR